jgi:zinc transport system substrate-binding protein
MSRIFLFFVVMLTTFLSFLGVKTNLLADEKPAARPYVLVSVAPHKFFVEKIAKDTVEVKLMVPAGASSHTFEPTPQQMLKASQADLWFQIGEGFEPRASLALKSYNPKMELINLRDGLDLIVDDGSGTSCCHCSQHALDSCVDHHFWLSPKQSKIQAQTIEKALSARYPEHTSLYKTNLASFQQELDILDKEIQTKLSPLKNRTIMVSHPAYAYFCRDYDLNQLSIEFEGKDPSPKQLTKVLVAARKAGSKIIYVQPQYSSKGAGLIAKQIGAKLVSLDPYAENYFVTMHQIAAAFASQ